MAELARDAYQCCSGFGCATGRFKSSYLKGHCLTFRDSQITKEGYVDGDPLLEPKVSAPFNIYESLHEL